MNESLLTVRYVKALFELAKEQKVIKQVREDMDNLLDCISGSSEFDAFLHNPLIKISEKNRLLREIFQNHVQSVTMQFLLLLIANKREMYLKEMARYYISYYKSSQGIKEAVLTTALAMKPDHLQEIHQFITRKFKVQTDLKEIVDPEIIGGFVLRIEDQQIDASMKGLLNRIERELIH